MFLKHMNMSQEKVEYQGSQMTHSFYANKLYTKDYHVNITLDINNLSQSLTDVISNGSHYMNKQQDSLCSKPK